MPRWDSEEGAAGDEAAAVRLANKIRKKRRAVSSSGASDPAPAGRRRLRSRRPAVLLPRRRAGDMSESSRSLHCRGGGGNRLAADGTTRPSASARRLVDAFWQDVDRSMLLEADARRSLVPLSGASTEVSGGAVQQIDEFGCVIWGAFVGN